MARAQRVVREQRQQHRRRNDLFDVDGGDVIDLLSSFFK